MVNVASILTQKKLKGNNLAIITHAGGPAVMLTDRLQKAGIHIPEIDTNTQEKLLDIMHPGSSATNPVDMLATGNRDQLEKIIEICDNLDYIDGSVVIYGKTGMEDLFQAYERLSECIDKSKKPVFTVMPSAHAAQEEIKKYCNSGKSTFFDEVVFAEALDLVIHAPKAYQNELFIPENHGNENDLHQPIPMSEEETLERLKWAGIPLVPTEFIYCLADLPEPDSINFPVVAKVLGILHKTEVDGVVLNIRDHVELKAAFEKLSAIPGSKGMLVQEMVKGTELYLGAKMHDGIGYSVHAGTGGIFIELIRDVAARLAPIQPDEAYDMLMTLKAQKIFRGFRNMQPVSAERFALIIHLFSNIFRQYPDIREIDLNPLIASGDQIVAVDARIII
jgi:acetyltransferase